MTRTPHILTLAAIGTALLLVTLDATGAAIMVLGAGVLIAAWALKTASSGAGTLNELRQADEALRASESKFAGILAIAADAIITVDGRQNILHFNWGAEQIFGYTEREVRGRPLNVLLPERFRPTHASYVDGFAQTPESARRMGHRREIFGLRKSGAEFPAEASISKLGAGPDVLFTVVLRDISDRKRAEQEQRYLSGAGALLASSLEMESTLAEIVEVGRPMLADACLVEVLSDSGEVVVLASGHDDDDIAARLREASRQPAQLAGLFPASPAAAQGGGAYLAYDAAAPNPGALTRRERELTTLLDARAVVVVPLRVANRTLGRLLLVATGARRFTDGDLPLAAELGARCSLALESARLYDAAHRATTARDDVLGVVSHDLRNPISAIAMCARVLRETPPDDPAERTQLLEAIMQSTDWANRLIQDLLDVASIEAGRLSMECSHETAEVLVQSALTMVTGDATGRTPHVRVDVAPSIPPLYADAGRVVQVLTNLIGNAIKFTPAEGHVVVAAAHAAEGVRFSVTDDGPGIPSAELPQVFERFWHARRGSRRRGSGLGLAIAKGIVDAHGGQIGVESTEGKGSTFWFTIPQKDRA